MPFETSLNMLLGNDGQPSLMKVVTWPEVFKFPSKLTNKLLKLLRKNTNYAIFKRLTSSFILCTEW